ncbi:MAG: nitronate monooxygenase [Dehalococcoidia bacterium]|nr:nitronate monooxygenase [Dehalococcoidia bacterium]
MQLHTAVCDLLRIERPVGNAGMAGGTAGPALAAAVANAGGLGGLGGVSRRGPAGLRDDIRRTRELTGHPFSVNLWVHILPALPQLLDVCIEERVPSVTFTFGDAQPYVRRAKDAGIIVLHQVQTVAQARQAAAAGVDVIIAQGGEAGGHTGSVATMALVPQAVDTAAGVPVLAAGGIADGRGLVAALALGAQGVIMGTRFVAAEESEPPAYQHRERILAATADDTIWTDVFDIVDGIPWPWPEWIHGRTVRTEFAAEWHGREAELREQIAAIRAEATVPQEAPARAQSAYAGQASGLVRDVKPAAAIIDEIMREADEVLAQLPRP